MLEWDVISVTTLGRHQLRISNGRLEDIFQARCAHSVAAFQLGGLLTRQLIHAGDTFSPTFLRQLVLAGYTACKLSCTTNRPQNTTYSFADLSWPACVWKAGPKNWPIKEEDRREGPRLCVDVMLDPTVV